MTSIMCQALCTVLSTLIGLRAVLLSQQDTIHSQSGTVQLPKHKQHYLQFCYSCCGKQQSNNDNSTRHHITLSLHH